MAFNLRVDSLSGNANNRYWVPFNEPRPGEPSEAFLRRGHGSNWTYPRPRPRRARFPFASCDLRLDDSPRCRPTDNSTTVHARTCRSLAPRFVQPRPTDARPSSRRSGYLNDRTSSSSFRARPFSRARLIILGTRPDSSRPGGGRGSRRSSRENRSLKISRLRRKGGGDNPLKKFSRRVVEG